MDPGNKQVKKKGWLILETRYYMSKLFQFEV